MRQVLPTLSLVMVMGAAIWAQAQDDSKPATSNLPGAEYPRIHADLRVTFRISAPGEQKVQVIPGGNDNGLGQGPFDMQRDDKGLWTVTIGPAATLHAALAIPNVTMIEAPWVNGDGEGDVVKPYPTVEKGFALPLEGPGLGVAFDEMLAKARPFRKPALQPRLNAPDGSVRDF